MKKHLPLIPSNIRPFFQVAVFSTKRTKLTSRQIKDFLKNISAQSRSKNGNTYEKFNATPILSQKDTLILFVKHSFAPTWLRKGSAQMLNVENDIIIIHYHGTFCYAHSNCHTLLDALFALFKQSEHAPISSQLILKILGQKNLEYRTLGIQNIFNAGGMAPEAKSYYGRDTKFSLSTTYDGGYGFSHCFASERVGTHKVKPFGCSTKKNKVWQTWVKDIATFKNECHKLTALLNSRPGHNAFEVLVHPVKAPRRVKPISFYMDFTVHRKGTIALGFDNDEFDLNWDAYLSPDNADEVEFVSHSHGDLIKRIKSRRETDEWKFEYVDEDSINLKFYTDAAELEDRRSKDLIEYLNENSNFTLLFDDGVGYRDRVYWQDNRFKLPFQNSENLIPWNGVDIQTESKLAGRSDTIADAVEKYFGHASLGINDDGANEAADFIVLAGNRFILVHSKFSGKDTAGLRVDDLQVVCSQALKNMRFFLPDAVEPRLDRWYQHIFTQTQPDIDQFKSDIKEQLQNPNTQKECWIIQPGISKQQLDHAVNNKIHILLNHVESVCRSQNILFKLICGI